MSRILKPQKAANAVLESLRFPAICQPKIDGCRGLFITNKFTGRSLKPFKNQNITDAYSHPLLAGFDGELAYGDIHNPNRDLCRNTTGLVNSLRYNTNGDIPDLYVFDYLTEETAYLPYLDRFNLAKAMVTELTTNSHEFNYLKIVPRSVIVTCIEDVEQMHQLYLSLGFEGTIVRWTAAPHKNGRSTVRESYFMRIKDFETEEAEVVDFSEAQENLNPVICNALGQTERSTAKAGKLGKGMIGNLTVRRASGEEILIGPGKLSHEERQHYFENPSKILGGVVTFSFMPYGSFNKPRFALFENFRAEEDL